MQYSAGRIFGPNRHEVAKGWKRLHNEKLLNFNVSARQNQEGLHG